MLTVVSVKTRYWSSRGHFVLLSTSIATITVLHESRPKQTSLLVRLDGTQLTPFTHTRDASKETTGYRLFSSPYLIDYETAG